MNELELYKLFTKIISKSKKLKGRFVVADGYGNDLNKDNFGDIEKDIIGGLKSTNKYPVALLFPPVEIPENYEDNSKSTYKLTMYFLDKPFAQKNSIVQRNTNTNQSDKKVEDTWKEMVECAKSFRKAFNIVADYSNGFIHENERVKDVISRYSDTGADKVSGCELIFEINIFQGCDYTDYDLEDLTDIKI